MTFYEQALIAAMQAVIARSPSESPKRVALLATLHAKALVEHHKNTPTPNEILLWWNGKQIAPSELQISRLEFSIRVQSCLANVNVHTVADLMAMTERNFLNIPGIGKGLRQQVLDFMRDQNIQFSDISS